MPNPPYEFYLTYTETVKSKHTGKIYPLQFCVVYDHFRDANRNYAKLEARQTKHDVTLVSFQLSAATKVPTDKPWRK